jgi:sterol-4alpha-carboxylate 3-dehydrogenase (decarboxylating)
MLDLYVNGKTNFQVGNNENLFDFSYVGNVAHAHLLAAYLLLATHERTTSVSDQEKVDGEAFMITNDAPVYFWDFPRQLWKIAGNTKGTEGNWIITKDVGIPMAALAETILPLIGRTSKLTRRGIRYSCMTRYYNINKAKQRLGYRPIVSMKEGIERAVKANLQERKMSEKK